MGLEPRTAGWWPKEMRLCRDPMQDREEEGCWNITIGYVFIQEPYFTDSKSKSKSAIYKTHTKLGEILLYHISTFANFVAR